MTDQQRPALTVVCAEQDYTGDTGAKMQAHAHETGHGAFYVVAGLA